MQIILKDTPDQVALIKAMSSKDRDTQYEAKAAVATLVGPILAQVINEAPTISNFYRRMPFKADENPSIPLDLFHDITDLDFIRIHSQTVAGGLSSSELFPAHDELKFKTYSLDSAWSFDKRYAKMARLDVVSKIFTRMAQEFMFKQEKTAVNQLLGALIAADTKVNGTAAAGNHVIRTATANVLSIVDFNKLMTLSKRLWTSFAGGTPSTGVRVGATDLIISPEMVEEIRAMAYQPVNTRAVPDTAESTAIPATDEMRNKILNSAGMPSIFNISLIELLELGVGQRYNLIFDKINVAKSSPVTFTQASDEIMIGIDRAKSDALIRPVLIDEDASSEVSVMVDDQFVDRSKKTGFYAELNEGRIILEDRVLVGLIA